MAETVTGLGWPAESPVRHQDPAVGLAQGAAVIGAEISSFLANKNFRSDSLQPTAARAPSPAGSGLGWPSDERQAESASEPASRGMPGSREPARSSDRPVSAREAGIAPASLGPGAASLRPGGEKSPEGVGPVVAGDLGSEDERRERRHEEPSVRLKGALQAVSRETLSGAVPVQGQSPEGRSPLTPGRLPAEGADSLRAFGGRRGESEDRVSIPAGSATASAADTPIARAAQAAVVARSGGEIWPRPRACRVMTIANQKGGVGKTTTAVNIAASLAMHGVRVLVIDLDPQGNASTALDVDHHSGITSIYNVLVEGEPLASVVRPVAGFSHLYCAPAAIDLAGAEIELVPLVARESRLARALAGYDTSSLDYIIIDCPPSLGLLTVNALVAAPEVLIPIQCEYYALEGLEQLLRTVDLVRSHLNPVLSVSTILLTMYDGRTRLATQVADEVREHFGGIVLGSVIPRSVRVSEAPSYGQSVMTYDPGSSGAQAYMAAAEELASRSVQQSVG